VGPEGGAGSRRLDGEDVGADGNVAYGTLPGAGEGTGAQGLRGWQNFGHCLFCLG